MRLEKELGTSHPEVRPATAAALCLAVDAARMWLRQPGRCAAVPRARCICSTPPGGAPFAPSLAPHAVSPGPPLRLQVGKAYLSLSRLYLAGCEDSAAKQLATAALSRSWEILNVCQVCACWRGCCLAAVLKVVGRTAGALSSPVRVGMCWLCSVVGWVVCHCAALRLLSCTRPCLQLALKKQPSCTSSFSYLMEKIRTAEAAPLAAALAPLPLPVGAAPPASVGVPPSALPAAAAALSLASPPPAGAQQRQQGGPLAAH